MLSLDCMLITLIIAHIFYYKLNAFFPWAQSYASFKKKNQSNCWVSSQLSMASTSGSTAGFLANYLWPTLLDYLDGFHPFKVQIG